MDMEALMAQAQELQNKVTAAQEKLAATRIKGLSADGSCIMEITGKYDFVSISIKQNILAGGAKKVESVVAEAFRDAKAKADKIIDEVMGQATAGVPMP